MVAWRMGCINAQGIRESVFGIWNIERIIPQKVVASFRENVRCFASCYCLSCD
jgi:hypothetical protein